MINYRELKAPMTLHRTDPPIDHFLYEHFAFGKNTFGMNIDIRKTGATVAAVTTAVSPSCLIMRPIRRSSERHPSSDDTDGTTPDY